MLIAAFALFEKQVFLGKYSTLCYKDLFVFLLKQKSTGETFLSNYKIMDDKWKSEKPIKGEELTEFDILLQLIKILEEHRNDTRSGMLHAMDSPILPSALSGKLKLDSLATDFEPEEKTATPTVIDHHFAQKTPKAGERNVDLLSPVSTPSRSFWSEQTQAFNRATSCAAHFFNKATDTTNKKFEAAKQIVKGMTSTT